MLRCILLSFALVISPAAAIAQSGTDNLIPLTCLLSPDMTSDIGSDRTGIVEDVPVSRADLVEIGDVLVELDTARIRAELRLSEITIEALTAQIARSERLSENNLIPADEIEQQRTELKLADAEADRARLELDKSFVRAPFSGVVTSVSVAPGEVIGSEPLMQLVDISTLKAEMIFFDSAFGEIEKGREVELTVDLLGVSVWGKVIAIDPVLDAASNSFSVSAEIANEDFALPAGVSCRVTGWR